MTWNCNVENVYSGSANDYKKIQLKRFNLVPKNRVKGRETRKGPGKRGHVVVDTLLLMMFLGRARDKLNVVFPFCANWETFVADTKCFWTKSETFWNHKKVVSATNVACAGKRGNICVGNNVSSFARAFKYPLVLSFSKTNKYGI